MCKRFYPIMLLALMSIAGSADVCASTLNLVTNGGFETGTLADWSLSGTQSAPGFEGISYGVDTADAHSGTYGAYLGGYGGYLSLFQSFATSPGATYQITYYLAQAPATPAPYTSGFNTYFDGVALFLGGNAPLLPFTRYSFTATANGTESTLTFSARDDTGYFSLDDISVISTPEPTTYFVWIPLAYLFLRRTRRNGL